MKALHYAGTFSLIQVQLFKPLQGSAADMQDCEVKIVK